MGKLDKKGNVEFKQNTGRCHTKTSQKQQPPPKEKRPKPITAHFCFSAYAAFPQALTANPS